MLLRQLTAVATLGRKRGEKTPTACHRFGRSLMALAFSGVMLAAGPLAAQPSAASEAADATAHPTLPVWTTSSRLLKLGESLDFAFRLPSGVAAGSLRIYPRYLEQADPGPEFKAGGDLKWLARLPSEQLSLNFTGGQAALTYRPKQTGNYLAEWRVGTEAYYRYFAVIDDTYIVLSFSTFGSLAPEPNLHGTGIPLDYRLPMEKFTPHDAVGRKLLDYNHRFGELVVPVLPDLPASTDEERARVYGEGMGKARDLLPDPLDHRSIRVEMRHNEDPGYPRTFAGIGVNDHCGLIEANCMPWLGMPEFLYYSSPEDSRKVNQAAGGEIVAHQWDFCGSFHFLGPVDWHYSAGEGRFEQTVRCLSDGMDELRNLTEMNGHPAFVTPLYGGTDRSWGDNPNPTFYAGDHQARMLVYAERYQRLVAFELTKEYHAVFARSIDLVDYFRRHFKVTPRTVYSSKSRHIRYDAWWTQGALNHYGVLYTPERIPWSTRLSTVQKMRLTPVLPLPGIQDSLPFKDPLSCEFILIEEQKRQMRFERESPNPIWWFDYTRKDKSAKGSVLNATTIPDVQIRRAQSFDEATGLTITLTMKTQASFPGYAIALWNLPIEYGADPADIVTSGLNYTLVKNTDGETHLVLDFDLKPDAEVKIILRKPKATWWEW